MGAAYVNASVEAEQRKVSHLHPTIERIAQDEHVVTGFSAEKGRTRCRISYRGGVEVSVPHSELQIGDSSTRLRLEGVSVKDKTLILTAYVKQPAEALFTLRTGWKLMDITGATVESREGNFYRMVLQVPSAAMPSAGGGYVKVHAQLRFANR